MSAEDISRSALEIIETYTRLGLKIATAESCTGGMVSAALTAISGSSAVLERGFVTYSNDAKAEMMVVPPALIAERALRNSHANVSISITGVAGPGGGSVLKPVGLVHFACAKKGSQTLHIERRFGDLGREMMRIRSVLTALDLLRQVVEERDQ